MLVRWMLMGNNAALFGTLNSVSLVQVSKKHREDCEIVALRGFKQHLQAKSSAGGQISNLRGNKLCWLEE